MEYVLPKSTLAEGLPDLILPHFLDHGDENAWQVSARVVEFRRATREGCDFNRIVKTYSILRQKRRLEQERA